MHFAPIDSVVLAIHALDYLSQAQSVSRDKATCETASNGYFQADKAPSWSAIGASLIAVDVPAEKVIGLPGSGYAIGSYERMAAVCASQ